MIGLTVTPVVVVSLLPLVAVAFAPNQKFSGQFCLTDIQDDKNDFFIYNQFFRSFVQSYYQDTSVSFHSVCVCVRLVSGRSMKTMSCSRH